MEYYQFNICGIPMELRTEQPVTPEADMLLFSAPAADPALRITCRCTDSIPEAGELLGELEGQKVYRSGPLTRRVSWTGRAPYAALTYETEAMREAALDILRKDWSWATRGLRLWIAACFPQLLLHFRAVLIHASMIDYRGQGILFTAPSQTGKSTQAELWRRYRGAEVVNGDKAGIRMQETAMVHSVPFSGTSGICKNRSLPLRAIVVLSQAPENRVQRLTGVRAVSAVCQNIFSDHAVPEEWSMALSLVMDIAEKVSVYALACTPDERAVEALEQALDAERA